MVNNYIKELSGQEFTAKDFRTWSGSLQAFLALKSLGSAQTQAESKRKIAKALEVVSRHLGNSSNVCRKYYVHPMVLSVYETKGLESYFSEEKNYDKNQKTLKPEEKMLMNLFKKETFSHHLS